MTSHRIRTELQPLSEKQLLDAWESGATQPGLQRTLPVLQAALPELQPADLLRVTLGQRNDCLLALHSWLFGQQLAAVASCPSCRTSVEIDANAEALRCVTTESLPDRLSVQLDGWLVCVGSPSIGDLIAARDRIDTASLRQHLIERCVLSASRGDVPQPFDSLPEPLLEKVGAAAERTDPLAHIALSLRCPECEHEWSAGLDVAAFFWAEVEAWARRTLADVHGLAQAYGWSEAQILELGRRRRQLYLELVEAD